MSILSLDRQPAILEYLGSQPAPPTLEFLDALLVRYTRTVPWESASRIVRRANTANTADCPRWPNEFWQTAIEHGTGGTCFESNLAFFALLRTLGFEGYLTINNMGDSIGCHTAIVILLDGQPYLTDVGLPIFAALPLNPNQPMSRTTPFLTYTTVPIAPGKFEIERSPHPKPNCFTLIDTPIDLENYVAATTNDYGDEGLFLNRVVINKVVNEELWRFSNDTTPLRMESFPEGVPIHHPIGNDPATTVANQFGIDVEIVRSALALTPTQT